MPTHTDAARWRSEVGRFRIEERRRTRFPLRVHIGEPAGQRVRFEVPWPVPATYDVGLRFDLLDAALSEWRAGHEENSASAWLTRPGVPVQHDSDLQWYASAAHVFGAHELALDTFRALTRTGWFDVVTGQTQVWRRLRVDR